MLLAVFNGVEVLLIAAVILAVVAGRWCLRRAESTRQRGNDEAIAIERRERVRIAYEQTAAEWNAAEWPRPGHTKESEAA